MPGKREMLGFAAALAATAGLAACGDDSTGNLPEQTGEELIQQLEAIEGDVAKGECDVAADRARALSTRVSALPADQLGGEEARKTVVAATAKLVALTQDPEQCTPPDTGATGETGFEETTTSTTSSTTTTTTETTPEPEQPEETDEGNSGSNSGSGNGNGNGPPATPPGQEDDELSGGIGSD